MAQLRSWLDMYPSTMPRPTVPKSRYTLPTDFQFRGVPTLEQYQEPYISPYEILDEMRERFEAQPVSFGNDPATGQPIATKTMAKTEMPSEMAGMDRFSHLFGKGDLSFNWMLPKGAMTGPSVLQRTRPLSDIERQAAGLAGRTARMGQTTAMVNPQRNWPSSAFTLPTRQASGGAGYAKPTPVFEGTVDYSTGEWHTRPGRFGFADPYGTFESRAKTPPTIGAYQPIRYTRKRRLTQRTGAER